MQDGSAQDKYSEIGGFNATMQITNFIGSNKLKYGLTLEGNNTDYQFVNQYGKTTEQKEPTTNISAFATYKINAGKWLLDPGVRLIYYASRNITCPLRYK